MHSFSETDIEYLIAKSLTEELSDDEKRRLSDWRNESPDHERLYTQILHGQYFPDQYELYNQVDTQKAWNRFRHRVYTSRSIGKVWRYVAAVALPLLVLGGWAYYYTGQGGQPSEAASLFDTSFSEATLVSDAGEQTLTHLDSLQQIPIGKGHATLVRKGELSLLEQNRQVADKDTVTPDNTLLTEVGKEYRITLSDGTRVHLNYNTRLKFPVVFGKKARVVYLKGEAFFEVAHDAERPFYVVTENIKIKQYGTAFNVNAYSSDNTSVVLVKGSVSLLMDGSEAEILMKPHQRAIIAKEGKQVQLEEVNIEKYTAWNDGYFFFEDEPLENIMETLANWYDVKVVYESPEIKKLRFTGALDRYSKVNQTLRALGRTVDVKIKITGRTIAFSN